MGLPGELAGNGCVLRARNVDLAFFKAWFTAR
jgi:hypothetical protein